MRRLSRPSHSTVAAYLALVVALSGSAYAAATIKSSDIVDDQVTTADVRDDSLKGGGLTGEDIREGSLGTVKNARKVNKIAASKAPKRGKLLALDSNSRLPAGPSHLNLLDATPCTRDGKEGAIDAFHAPQQSVGADTFADLTLNCLVADNLEPNDTEESSDYEIPQYTQFSGVSIFPAGDVDDVNVRTWYDAMWGSYNRSFRLRVPSGAELAMDVYHDGSLVAENTSCYYATAAGEEVYRVVVSGAGDAVAEYRLDLQPYNVC